MKRVSSSYKRDGNIFLLWLMPIPDACSSPRLYKNQMWCVEPRYVSMHRNKCSLSLFIVMNQGSGKDGESWPFGVSPVVGRKLVIEKSVHEHVESVRAGMLLTKLSSSKITRDKDLPKESREMATQIEAATEVYELQATPKPAISCSFPYPHRSLPEASNYGQRTSDTESSMSPFLTKTFTLQTLLTIFTPSFVGLCLDTCLSVWWS